MRILYSHRVRPRDAQHAQIMALTRALRAEGHLVHLVGPGLGGGDGGKLLETVRRRLPGAAAEWMESVRNARAVRRLRRAAALFKPELIYERSGPFLTAGAQVAPKVGALLYLEVGAVPALEGSRAGARAARTEIDMWRAADRVLAAWPALADMVAAAGVPRAKISVVPPGVDPARVPIRPARADGAPVSLLYWCNGTAWPGLEALIAGLEAAPDTPNVTLTVLGGRPERGRKTAGAARKGLAKRIRYVPAVPSDDMATFLAAQDIVLLPPGSEAASPLPIFDCLAAGCAIVAADQPATRAILKHRRNALLFDPADAQFMWNAAQWLIEEPALRLQLGEAGRAWALSDENGWPAVAARITALALNDMAPAGAAALPMEQAAT